MEYLIGELMSLLRLVLPAGRRSGCYCYWRLAKGGGAVEFAKATNAQPILHSLKVLVPSWRQDPLRHLTGPFQVGPD